VTNEHTLTRDKSTTQARSQKFFRYGIRARRILMPRPIYSCRNGGNANAAPAPVHRMAVATGKKTSEVSGPGRTMRQESVAAKSHTMAGVAVLDSAHATSDPSRHRNFDLHPARRV